MKNLKKIAIIIFLFLFYIYVCNITLLPSSYIMMQGETFQIPMVLGLSLQENNSYATLQTASSLNKTKVNEVGKIDLNLSLFQLLTVKNIQVNVIPKTTVVPVGAAIGMKLYTDGVLVVGMSEIEGKKPYENSGIQKVIELFKLTKMILIIQKI